MSTASSSTADVHQGFLLALRRDGEQWFVRDMIGKRYGAGATPGEALAEWWFQVNDLLTLKDPAGPPLSHEIAAYRKAAA